jgi:hypothetical protein
MPQKAAVAEPATTPRARHLKHVVAHIHQNILLQNIVMNIEIEVTSFIVLGRIYYIIVHVHACIQYNFYYNPYFPKSK